ncbi:MAG: DUF6089 family protein [Saprospiraceae bacterium]
MKQVFLTCLGLALAATLSAQISSGRYRHYLEVGLTAGASNYSGDLTERALDLRQSRPAFGIFGRFQLSQSFLLKGQLLSGRIYGDDKFSKTHADRTFRVNSPFQELSIVLEYAPFYFGFENSAGKEYYFFPYVFGGIGGTYANPKLQYYGSPENQVNVIREPLPEGGESQRTFLCTPIGGGIRLNINHRMTLGLEAGLRPVFSDLLDGISKNGNPAYNDWYYFAGFSASYYLGHPWQLKE